MAVTDDDGTGESQPLDISVANVAPSVRILAADPVEAGQPIEFIVEATDIGAADRAAGFTYEIDFDNDGTPDQILNGVSGPQTVNTTYATPGNVTAGFTARDQDGDETNQTVQVEVVTAAADFNGDNAVNGQDLSLWVTGFGITENATPGDGDANSDGAVNGADFLFWQQFTAVSEVLSAAATTEPIAAPLAESVASDGELVDVAIAVLLQEQSTDDDGSDELLARAEQEDFFFVSPPRRDVLEANSSTMHEGSTPVQEQESGESPAAWEDVLDEVFALAFG